MINRARASALLAGGAALGAFGLPAAAAPRAVPGLNKIDHIIVIYLENRSFDHLYGRFPGADGLDNAAAAPPQVDENGAIYPALPAFAKRALNGAAPSLELPPLPNRPFDLAPYVPIDRPLNAAFEEANNYYQAMQAINGGKMDRYVAISGSPVMGYYDGSSLPMWAYAQEYVLCDRFFQAAFGGTGMNHFLLFAGGVPSWPNAPAEFVAQLAPDGTVRKEGLVTPDGFIVNNLSPEAAARAPLQTTAHIGDRLDAAGVSWAWYAGYTTQAARPFLLFENVAAGTPGAKAHIKAGEDEFVADLKNGRLPQVAFMKPAENEHPKEQMGLLDADRHAAALVQAVMDSAYWKRCAIVVTYDEGHSFWDHVAPPKIDRWGPGRRVPALVISPFAKKRYVDHTRYDTTSILKLIETRFALAPLGPRDAAAADLTAALNLE
ncbi:MAG: alkaline phosphatase family protein [Candidatus Lustribacter sp.]